MKNTNYHLHLKGYVGGCDFDRNYVDYILARNEGKPVNVLIDSLGGSLATALSIASAFRAHGDVTVHFVGMNASAATIASLGAKHISMDSSAMYLVHKCSAEFFEWGSLNADQLAEVRDNCEAAIRDLNKLDNNVASMYAGKCSKKQEALLDLMREGGWLTAAEALEWGFVDEVTQFNEEKPVLTDAVASAMAAAGMPIPNLPMDTNESLLSRFIAALASIFKPNKVETHAEPIEVKSETSEENQEPENTETQVSNEQNQSEPMKRLFKLVGAVLKQEDFAVGEDGVTLTADQMQCIEDALSERDERNNELTEQVNALKAAPAEKSNSVVDSSHEKNEPVSAFDGFAKTVNTAKELYKMVP